MNKWVFVRDAVKRYKDWLRFTPYFNSKKLVYISGPMTGIENNNQESFDEAAEKLIEIGYTPVNPADITTYADIESESYNEHFEQLDLPLRYETYMSIDLAILPVCTHFVRLPGWENSKGATVEYAAARSMKLDMSLQKFLQENKDCGKMTQKQPNADPPKDGRRIVATFEFTNPIRQEGQPEDVPVQTHIQVVVFWGERRNSWIDENGICYDNKDCKLIHWQLAPDMDLIIKENSAPKPDENSVLEEWVIRTINALDSGEGVSTDDLRDALISFRALFLEGRKGSR